MFRFRSLAIYAIFICGSAQAAELTLTVQSASDDALRNNPSLRAARFRIAEAQGRLKNAGRLSNPEFELEHVQSTSSAERSTSIRLEQRFPITSRLRLEKRIAETQIAAAAAEVREAERILAKEVQETCVKLLALRERIEVARSQAANSRELSGFLQQRVTSGEVSSIDAAQVDLESEQLETEIVELQTEDAALLGELKRQLGASPHSSVHLRGDLAALPKAPGADWRDRPDLQVARFHAEAADQEVGLARANRWEDWTLGLGGDFADEIDEPEGLSDEQFIGVRLKIPLPVWNDNRGRVEETAAAAKRAQAEVASLENVVANEAGAALREMRAQARLLQALDGSLLAKSKRFEEMVRQSFDAGQTSLQEVLRSRERRLSVQRRRVDVLERYQLARVRHLAATGSILPRRDSKR